MEDSGQGWDCIVDIKCADASGEREDNPGTGPGIAVEVIDTIGNTAKKVVNFFKGFFSKENSE